MLQHNLPSAEDLRRQKLSKAAIGLSAVFGRAAHQIMHIAMQHEHAGRAREVQLGQFARPSREPSGELPRGFGADRHRFASQVVHNT